ncbi:MAG: extracellular solute-binding protein [Lachnospiraceae bacterium]|nr:extracellular solute-binding protein [Lachnospiraceae bacterium]
MKRKMVSLLLAAAMVTGLLAGCSSSSASSTSSSETSESTEETADTTEAAEETSDLADYSGVTLTYWSMWTSTEPQAEVIQQAADAFSEQTGATINIEWKGRDISSVILSALESGEDIDLFEDSDSRISQNYADYCYDLTEMAEAADYASYSYACFTETITDWAGFLACIVEQPQVGGVWYNKDIFEACGIDVPTTWEEFMDACQTMVDNGYQPLALDSAYASFNFGYHLDRYLGEDAVSELSLNGGWSDSAGAIQAAQDIIDFVNAGYLADGAPDEYPSSQNKIGLTGQVAMVVCANYVTSEVDNNSGVDTNWGMFNYPSIDGGVDPSNAYAGANCIAISSYSENAQAAFDFIMFLTTGEYDQLMADTAEQIPADPNNTAPDKLSGTVEALLDTSDPLKWNMGLTDNSDLSTGIKENVVKLFEGQYATGEEFAAAMDALY